jgi:hypothetical protein
MAGATAAEGAGGAAAAIFSARHGAGRRVRHRGIIVRDWGTGFTAGRTPLAARAWNQTFSSRSGNGPKKALRPAS